MTPSIWNTFHPLADLHTVLVFIQFLQFHFIITVNLDTELGSFVFLVHAGHNDERAISRVEVEVETRQFITMVDSFS